MATLGMGKSYYNFDRETINDTVTKTSAGNYALGYLSKRNQLSIYGIIRPGKLV